MTRWRLSRDLRQLAFALCLGIPFIILLILIGSLMLLSTFDEPSRDTHEPTGSFVCMSDAAGTLLLCEQNYPAHVASAAWPSRTGSIAN